MSHELSLKRLAIKFSFKHSLLVYGRMDDVGNSLKGLFEHWSRQPLALRLFDRKKHRQFLMKCDECFFSTEWPEDGEAQVGLDALGNALKKFGISKTSRVGIQYMFVAKEDIEFDELMSRQQSKFLIDPKQIPAFSNTPVKDIMYIVDCDSDSGWRRSVNIGPMTRDEWFSRMPPENDLFEQKLEGANIFNYRDSFPDVFTFISIDASKRDIQRHDAIASVVKEGAKSVEMAGQLVEYIRS